MGVRNPQSAQAQIDLGTSRGIGSRMMVIEGNTEMLADYGEFFGWQGEAAPCTPERTKKGKINQRFLKPGTTTAKHSPVKAGIVGQQNIGTLQEVGNRLICLRKSGGILKHGPSQSMNFCKQHFGRRRAEQAVKDFAHLSFVDAGHPHRAGTVGCVAGSFKVNGHAMKGGRRRKSHAFSLFALATASARRAPIYVRMEASSPSRLKQRASSPKSPSGTKSPNSSGSVTISL